MQNTTRADSSEERFITLENVTLRVRDRHILTSTCWEIESNQNWAVLGPNGSGKSTLMRALIGDAPVVRGTIMRHHPMAQPDYIGYVSFELHQQLIAGERAYDEARYFSGKLNTHLTVRQLIKSARKKNKLSNKTPVNKILSIFGIEHLMDRSVRNDQFSVRFKNHPKDLREKTLGLLGFGRIGSDLSKACQNIFQMNIIAYDPFLPDDVKKKYGTQIRFVDLKTLFSEADVISIHVPLTEDTRHIAGEQEISWMKPDAIIINTARGPVMDEAALVQALKADKIGGAGLDVFENEPVAPDNPLLKLDNVILTPHTAALTRECVIRMATEAAQCVIDVMDGKIPKNIANTQILKSEKRKHLIPRD